MIRVALLSRWHVHADEYAEQVQKHQDMEITCVWDEDDRRGKEWAAEFEVPFESDLNDLLAREDVDAVVVCTPTSMHYEVILAAIHAKKHVFSEKVLALQNRECDEILQTAEKLGTKLMLSLPRFSEVPFGIVSNLISRGWLGDVHTIRCMVAHDGSLPNERQAEGWLPEHFYDANSTGGGAFIDLGAHPIYIVNRLAGSKPVSSLARFRTLTGRQVEDYAVVMTTYENGCTGLMETNFTSKRAGFILEAHGTDGSVLIHNQDVSFSSVHVENADSVIQELELPDVPQPMEQWVSSILHDETTFITVDDMRMLTQVNVAAYQSAAHSLWESVE